MEMSPKMLLLIGGAVALYLMTREDTPAVTTLPAPGGPAPGPGPNVSPGPTGTVTPTPGGNNIAVGEPPSGNSLAAIYARMQASAATNGMAASGASPDQWNWLMAQVSSIVPPDPLEVWPTYDRTAGMTLSLPNYWATMSQFLKTSRGMSGLAAAGRVPRSYAYNGWIV